MDRLIAGLCLGALVLTAGCGKETKQERDKTPAEPVAADAAALAARDADPLRVLTDFWHEIAATNVESAIALSVDEGLDFKNPDVDGRMTIKKYRDYAAVATELFAGYTFESAELVQQRADRARVSAVLTSPAGETNKADLMLRQIGKKWRVDPFDEHGI